MVFKLHFVGSNIDQTFEILFYKEVKAKYQNLKFVHSMIYLSIRHNGKDIPRHFKKCIFEAVLRIKKQMKSYNPLVKNNCHLGIFIFRVHLMLFPDRTVLQVIHLFRLFS